MGNSAPATAIIKGDLILNRTVENEGKWQVEV